MSTQSLTTAFFCLIVLTLQACLDPCIMGHCLCSLAICCVQN